MCVPLGQGYGNIISFGETFLLQVKRFKWKCDNMLLFNQGIKKFILLHGKFLPFDWLKAEVFQLNLKYLHVKITATLVTQNHQKISLHELCKNGGKISRLWNQKIQELKENSETQNTEKSTSTWLNVWTSWAENENFKTNLLAYEAKQLDENKHRALDDWIYQVVV